MSGRWDWLSDGGGLTRLVAVDRCWSDFAFAVSPVAVQGSPGVT